MCVLRTNLSCVYFAQTVLGMYEDNAESFVSDIIDAGHLSERGSAIYLESLRALKKQGLLDGSCQDEFLGTLPIFSGFNVQALLLTKFKTVPKTAISSSQEEAVESGQELVDVEPMVAINVSANTYGDVGDFSFMMDERSLRRFMDELAVAQKRLAILDKMRSKKTG